MPKIDKINNDLIQDVLIINLTANLSIRKKGDMDRFLGSGHYVSNEIMINVYKEDIFKFNKMSERMINNFRIPVYVISNDNDLGKSQRSDY